MRKAMLDELRACLEKGYVTPRTVTTCFGKRLVTSPAQWTIWIDLQQLGYAHIEGMGEAEDLAITLAGREFLKSLDTKTKINALKIYLASSWKNAPYLKTLAQHLRETGYAVDCFCDPSLKRTVFKWEDLGIPPRTMDGMNAIHMLDQPKVRLAFREDKKWLDWADVVVMVLPCGNSAHLEAGYAKGAGKKLIIYGTFPPGSRDVMYGFADAMIPESFMDLCAALEKMKEKR